MTVRQTISASDNTPTKFEVKDIYIAAYLMSLGHHLIDVISEGFNSIFIFKDVPSSDVYSYYNSLPHPQLSAKRLFQEFQEARKLSRQVRPVSSSQSHGDSD